MNNRTGHSGSAAATNFTQIRTITWIEHIINLTAYHKVLDDDDDEWDPPPCSRSAIHKRQSTIS